MSLKISWFSTSLLSTKATGTKAVSLFILFKLAASLVCFDLAVDESNELVELESIDYSSPSSSSSSSSFFSSSFASSSFCSSCSRVVKSLMVARNGKLLLLTSIKLPVVCLKSRLKTKLYSSSSIFSSSTVGI
jgi:hypothetical protein